MNSVLVRMILYILSPVLATLVALIPGWGVSYDAATHVLTINLSVVIGAVVAALGLSGAVFARWGVR